MEINKQDFPKRLLHFHGDKVKNDMLIWQLQFYTSTQQKGVLIKEVPFCKRSIDETDVFILDLGLDLYLVSIVCLYVCVCVCVYLSITDIISLIVVWQSL